MYLVNIYRGARMLFATAAATAVLAAAATTYSGVAGVTSDGGRQLVLDTVL